MHTSLNFFDYIGSVKSTIDKHLEDTINGYFSSANTLKEAMHYSLLNGGKRMRPVLSVLVGDLLGANRDDINVLSMALECIHAYSLIHDDLPAMDDDDLRRGKPTNHIKYGEATAILAGDALQTLAFEILSTHPLSEYANSKRIELIAILSKSSGLQGMCAGQSIDLDSTGKDISLSELSELHNLKTGALLKAAVKMAVAVSPTATKADQEHLDEFASKIGLAFQVQDDVLDVIGDSAVLGKPQGSDESLDKNTYVSHLGLDGAKSFLLELHQQALQALHALPYNTQHLSEFTDYLVNRNH